MNEKDATLKADGFDDAIIGHFTRCGKPTVIAYDYDKCIEIIMRDEISLEDAHEHMEFNVVGGWLGEGTPAFVHLEELG